MAGGVPSRAITLRHYRPDDPRTLPTIRLSYPRIAAVAGPCGLWPQDLGPDLDNAAYNENRAYHNFGCATSATLLQWSTILPTSSSPVPKPRLYAAARHRLEKYRKGTSTATSYPESDKAKLSDTGK